MTAWPHSLPPPLLHTALSLPSNKTTHTSNCPSPMEKEIKLFTSNRTGAQTFEWEHLRTARAVRFFGRYVPSILRWESPSELRSFRRLVTHLYGRATSCLLQASTQLANRANSPTLKLN